MNVTTIYDLPIPIESEEEILEILKSEINEMRDFRRDYTRLFSRVYLTHIAPHEKRYRDMDMAVMKFMSCGRCIAKVWNYFRERYKKQIELWKTQF